MKGAKLNIHNTIYSDITTKYNASGYMYTLFRCFPTNNVPRTNTSSRCFPTDDVSSANIDPLNL